MPRFVMVVQSQALPGREAEYAAWYDGTHVKEICALPGVVSGQRYEATPVAMGAPGQSNLSIYEIEAESEMAFMGEMGKLGASGRMTQSDSYVSSDSVLWIYRKPE